MKTLMIFETAAEFFDACANAQSSEEEGVCLHRPTQIVFDGSRVMLQGEGAEGFTLDDSITQEDLVAEAFHRLGTSVYFT